MIEKHLPEAHECMPDKRVLFARLGTRYTAQINDHDFIHRINALFLTALKQIDPAVYHVTIDAETMPIEAIPSTFGDVKKISIFLSTLGIRFDKAIQQLLDQSKTFEATVMDAWGSEALETLNKKFDSFLRNRFGKGTMRFSPGYGNVDIRANRYIVKELLKLSEITVLDTGVMIPRKTTTCMIGWYCEENRIS